MLPFSRRSMRLIASGIVLFIFSLASFPQTAQAATYTVTTLAGDNSSGSLRWAYAQAAANAGDDVIDFSVSGTITITQTISAFIMNGAITINGGGAITVSGGNALTVFDFPSGSTVALNGLTITGGNAGGSLAGGGILSAGNLTIVNSTISGNTATYGGGIYHSQGVLTLVNTVVANNNADIGGALFNSGGSFAGSAVIINSTISGNNSGVSSGAPLTLRNTILANSGSGDDCQRTSGTITARNTQIEEGLSCLTESDSTNLSGDPALDSNLHLTSSSYGINAGNNTYISGYSTDRAGAARVQNTTVDLGAYESAFGAAPPSVVNISPAAVSIAEGTSGSITITRTGGSTASALTVYIDLTVYSGLTGTDYNMTGCAIICQRGDPHVAVTIAAGQASATLNFQASDDIPAEADESLTITLVSDAAYTLGTTLTSVVTIPANDLTVTTLSDSGEGSLRQALTNAANFAGDDTITFLTSPSDTILVNSPLFVYGNGAVNIDATAAPPFLPGGPGSVTVQRSSGSFTVFQITDVTATFNHITVTGGSSTTAGGGIYVRNSTVHINNSTVTGNTSDFAGGGIYILSGTVTLNNTTVTGNNTDGNGAGIFNLGALTITNSTITNNGLGTLSADNGGAIYHNGASLTITNSRITGNTASNGSAIYNDAASGGSVGSSTCITNNSNTAVVSASGSLTATGNWWGSSWGPSIATAPTDSGSYVSTGDSIGGTGQSTSSVNVGIDTIPADYGDYDIPPTGNWLATAPAGCVTCTQVSTISHGSRICN